MAGARVWPEDAQLAMSFVVNVEEGAEYNPQDGRHPEPVDELGIALKRPVRSLGNESSYQYGIRAGAPRVLALLDRYRITATFTAAAVALGRAPELARAIVALGSRLQPTACEPLRRVAASSGKPPNPGDRRDTA